MRAISLFLIITLSCSQISKKNPTLLDTAIQQNKVLNSRTDSIMIAGTWAKLFFNKMDSLTIPEISKYKNNETYPFFKLNPQIAVKYIKDYSEPESTGLYVISRQYSNERIDAVILFHWGMCIWDFYLVTIDKRSSEMIDKERILYSAENCRADYVLQKIKTVFVENKFDVSNTLEYWINSDEKIKDPTKADVHIKDSSLIECEIMPDGIIKRVKSQKKINVP